MLYTISRGNVPQYKGKQEDIVHLVTSVETVVDKNLPYVFADGHADVAFSTFYDDSSDLTAIDWQIMKETYWNDTEDDGDRKRRRQAEFLVHRFLPWHAVAMIGVHNEAIASRVQEILQGTAGTPKVVVHRDWYY
jgi:hypothetical protein